MQQTTIVKIHNDKQTIEYTNIALDFLYGYNNNNINNNYNIY